MGSLKVFKILTRNYHWRCGTSTIAIRNDVQVEDEREQRAKTKKAYGEICISDDESGHEDEEQESVES